MPIHTQSQSTSRKYHICYSHTDEKKYSNEAKVHKIVEEELFYGFWITFLTQICFPENVFVSKLSPLILRPVLTEHYECCCT